MAGWAKQLSVSLLISRFVGLLQAASERLEVTIWAKRGEVGSVAHWVRYICLPSGVKQHAPSS
ncbi:Uncharacterised protein [Segatella copri]|nr:Uncharacterised protein [Segatella copri]